MTIEITFTGPNFSGGPAQMAARLKRAASAKVARATEKRLRAGFRVLLDHTPVWSGDTIANYRVGVGEPDHSYVPYNQDEDPLSKNFQGGDRESAQAVSEASLEAAIVKIYRNPWAQVYITNNIRYMTQDGHEYGIEALENGVIGRSPYAMFSFARMVMENTDVSGI